MHSEELIIKLYRKNGYRITPQRQVIFNWLNNDHTHPTAEEIYQGIKSQMPDIKFLVLIAFDTIQIIASTSTYTASIVIRCLILNRNLLVLKSRMRSKRDLKSSGVKSPIMEYVVIAKNELLFTLQ